MKKSSVAALLAAAGFAIASPASAIVVGGIDFGIQGEDPINTHLETATLAQTYVSGNGQNATAYGYVTTINGDSSYCANNGTCGLFYIAEFTGSQNFTGSYVEFTGATVSVYMAADADALNLLNQDSPTNLATIQAMTLWLELSGHGNLGGGADPLAVLNGAGALTGSTLSGAGFGLLDVVLGAANASVETYLDTNGTPDAVGGLADIVFTSSFNNEVLNNFDVRGGYAEGCARPLPGQQTSGPIAGEWCYQGTANLRGVTQVPEPGLVGLLAIGLVGLGAAVRRRV